MIAMLVAAAPVTADSAIAAVMAQSAAGWNRGDLARFMTVYADDAVYVTAKGLVRGRRDIAARYAKSFTGKGNARGTLSFVPQATRTIDATHRLFIARWVLTPATGGKVETGMTTLLFERRAQGWRIVSDHSS